MTRRHDPPARRATDADQPDAAFRELVARAGDRDPVAAAEFVRRYEPELRLYVRFQLRNPQIRRLFDSLDVVQSVLAGFFARLYAGDVRAADPRQVFALLKLMARHKVADKAKCLASARRGGAADTAPLAAGSGVADPRPGPDELAAGGDLVTAVRDRLAPDLRTVLDRRLAGRGWADIADELGVTQDAVRKTFGRAVDQVAAELGLSGGGR